MSAIAEDLEFDDEKASAPRAWLQLLHRKGDGFAGDERNVLLALRNAPELTGLLRFNEFSHAVEFTRSPPWRACAAGAAWIETDATALVIWLQEHGIGISRPNVVFATVLLAAKDGTHHPVRDYLRSLTWDGMPRLETWLSRYMNATGPQDYLAAVGKRFMVSAVARIERPGCQADHVLVLEAPQGAGKSSGARALAVLAEWFAGSLPDIHSKDAAIQLIGRWIIEVSELRAIRNSQVEAVKAFLTQTVDTFRPPYGRCAAQFPRQCVFIATTNESEYLRDRTGNRRYWPVKCGRVDVAGLTQDRDQLWAEAMSAFKAGTAWHLTDAEAALATQEQSERVHQTELEADVAIYLRAQRDAGRSEITVHDVLVYGLSISPDSTGYTDAARKNGPAVAEAMELAGWKKSRRARSEDGRRTIYKFSGQGGQGK